MKKLILFVAIAAFGFHSNAQEFNAGLSGALPIGDAGDVYTFGLNVEANYLWNVSEPFQAGLTAGYHHYLLDGDFEGDDAGFLPVAASGRYSLSEQFSLGADLGYAVGISPDGNDGGFYYAPKLLYGISESIDVVLAYRGISVEDGSFDSISLGIEIGL